MYRHWDSPHSLPLDDDRPCCLESGECDKFVYVVQTICVDVVKKVDNKNKGARIKKIVKIADMCGGWGSGSTPSLFSYF